MLEFQRNAGLTGDAVCGPATLAVLGRITARNDDPISVAAVHEGETLRHSPRTLRGRRVVVGHAGGLDALTDAVVRALAETGAQAIPLHHLDGSAQAQQANGVGADVFVGLAAVEQGCSVAYYAAHGFESRGGRRVFAEIAHGYPDGLKTDGAGRVYTTCAEGIQIFEPDGSLAGEIRLPGAVNFAFGHEVLFITNDVGVWAASLAARGA